MRIFDISLPVDASIPVWPGDTSVSLDRFLNIECGDPVNASRVSCSVHVGTHVDAPAHHFASGAGVDAIPLDSMLGPAVVADLTQADQIGAAELTALNLPAGTTRLLCVTRNSRLWADSRFTEDFVAVAPDGAQWLIDRNVKLIGIDYLSVERFGAEPPDTHRRLLGAGVVIVEGLDLREVSAGRYWLACLPWKLRGSDGAPARVVLIDGLSE